MLPVPTPDLDRPSLARTTDAPDPPEEGAAPEEEERISITEVNGTIARFGMAYNLEPGSRLVFGPPLRMRLPSFVYLGVAMVGLLGVLSAYASPGSRLHALVVEGDRQRPISALAFALILLVSAIGTVLRAHMRGVLLHADGIEARDLMTLGIPRIRKWAWAQISRMVVDDDGVLLELWNGAYARLPQVASPREMGERLEHLGIARGIQVTRLKSSPRPPSSGS